MSVYAVLAESLAVGAKGFCVSAFVLWVVVGSQVQLEALTMGYRKVEFLDLSELRPFEYGAGLP